MSSFHSSTSRIFQRNDDAAWRVVTAAYRNAAEKTVLSLFFLPTVCLRETLRRACFGLWTSFDVSGSFSGVGRVVQLCACCAVELCFPVNCRNEWWWQRVKLFTIVGQTLVGRPQLKLKRSSVMNLQWVVCIFIHVKASAKHFTNVRLLKRIAAQSLRLDRGNRINIRNERSGKANRSPRLCGLVNKNLMAYHCCRRPTCFERNHFCFFVHTCTVCSTLKANNQIASWCRLQLTHGMKARRAYLCVYMST